jgi:hypothetical protein
MENILINFPSLALWMFFVFLLTVQLIVGSIIFFAVGFLYTTTHVSNNAIYKLISFPSLGL